MSAFLRPTFSGTCHILAHVKCLSLMKMIILTVSHRHQVYNIGEKEATNFYKSYSILCANYNILSTSQTTTFT